MTERPGEDDLIARFFAPLAGPAGLGLKDDAALLTPPPGRDLVLTTDALVAGVHFFADDPARRDRAQGAAGEPLRPRRQGRRRRSASCCRWPCRTDWTAEWLAAFARGLGEDAPRSMAARCSAATRSRRRGR